MTFLTEWFRADSAADEVISLQQISRTENSDAAAVRRIFFVFIKLSDDFRISVVE